MKNIILQVIQKILLGKKTALIFSHSVVRNLIESVNVYGFSIQEFKRTLRLLLTQHFHENPLVYIHLPSVKNLTG